MITIKESILSRSSHNGESFKAQRRNEIEKWLKEYDIKNYTINDDFTIYVNGNVNLFRRDLVEFPDYIQFEIVKGNFNCGSNKLTSLRGCPREVGRIFYCDINKLTSLEGAPKEVGENFYCSYNQLTSLEGAPKRVRRSFNCNYNKLTSLEGTPKEVGGYFSCNNNKLTTLEGAPKEIRGDFYCSRNSTQFTEDDVRKVSIVKEKIYC